MSHFKVIANLASCALLVFLTSCGGAHDQDEKYFLISTNVKIPYWQAGSAGLFQAAAQLKVRSEFSGPDSYDPKAEQKSFQDAVRSKPTASSAFEGIATCQPGACAHMTSPHTLCQGSPHLGA